MSQSHEERIASGSIVPHRRGGTRWSRFALIVSVLVNLVCAGVLFEYAKNRGGWDYVLVRIGMRDRMAPANGLAARGFSPSSAGFD
jgi:hypothetical protein